MPPLTERLYVDDLKTWFRLFQGDPGHDPDAKDEEPCITLTDVDSLILLRFLNERKEDIEQSVLDSAVARVKRRMQA
jgi:hypothetical protein